MSDGDKTPGYVYTSTHHMYTEFMSFGDKAREYVCKCISVPYTQNYSIQSEQSEVR